MGLNSSLGASSGKGSAAKISCLADIKYSGLGLGSSGANWELASSYGWYDVKFEDEEEPVVWLVEVELC